MKNSLDRFLKRITNRIPRNKFSTGCSRLLAVVLLALCGWLLAGHQALAANDNPEFVPDHLIVVFQSGVQDAQQAKIENAHGDQDVEALPSFNARLVKIRSNRSLAQALKEYQGDTNVFFVQPNYLYHAVATPNDPSYSSLWGMPMIGAPAAWGTTTGTRDVVVGVVDTGVAYTHPDLAANIWSNPGNIGLGGASTHGYNAIKNTYDPMDDNGHGTHVSGTIGAVGNNGLGVAGVNWSVSIMGLKFLDYRGSGTTANAIKAIDYAVQAKIQGVKVRVLNASWGGGGFDSLLQAEIQQANDNGILFVAAAGNNGTDNDTTPSYPANYPVPNVIAVAATDASDLLASFSNYGATTVHLGAPGVNILSTYWTRSSSSGYAWLSGTSMATPHVAGAAALVLAAQPSLTVDQLKAAILNNVDADTSLSGKTVTGGRLNVYKAVVNPAPTPDFSISISPSSSAVAYGSAGSATYTVTVTPLNGFTGPVTLTTASSVSVALGSSTVSFASGTPSAPLSVTMTASTAANTAAGTYPITVTGTSGTLSHTATASLVVATAATARFVGSDPNTQGNWIGKYGSDGYDIVHYKSPPIYGTVTPVGNSTADPWAQSGLGVVDLQTPDGLSRFSACYFLAGEFYLDVNLGDASAGGVAHHVSLYFVDRDSLGRSEDITVVDAATGATLDGPYHLTAFSSGQYLTWKISGHVHIKITWVNNAGANAVVSGIFFDPVPAPGFSLGISPASATVAPGSSATYTVNITRTGGFSGDVALSASGLPSGASASFSTTPTASSSSTLTIKTDATTPIGSFAFTVTGISSLGTQTATATLVVGVPDFSISASPASRTVRPGRSTTYTATVTPTGGFNGTVSFSVSTPLPPGATATFTPTSVTGSGSSTLKITTSSTTPKGTFPLTITGSSGTLNHDAPSVTLIISN